MRLRWVTALVVIAAAIGALVPTAYGAIMKTQFRWVTKPSTLKLDGGRSIQIGVVQVNQKYHCVFSTSEHKIGGGYTASAADSMWCDKVR